MSSGAARRLAAAVGAYFALYLAWRFSSWGSASTRAWVADVFLVLPGLPTVAFFWTASRRCGERRTASAWRWLTASAVFLTATFATTLGYQVVTGAVPFPSPIDGCEIAFFAVFLVGLLRFPKRAETRAGNLRLWVDVATVVVAGGAVIWFLVLGPTVTAGGQRLLDRAVAGAYPVGDLLQIFGLTYAISRVASRSTQRALRYLAIGTLVAIVGDVTNGWALLHSNDSLRVVVDLAFVGGWSLFVLAGPAQGGQDPVESRVGGRLLRSRWAAWGDRFGLLPYFAPAVVFGLMLYAQFDHSLTDRLGMVVAAAATAVLVLLRQFLARRDLLTARNDLSYLALHDGLTGLPNRTLVLDRAEQMLARARRRQTPAAALYIDIDGFKQVNDSLGHAAGDQLLQVVGARLASVIREADTAGRIGGDEFIVLLDSPGPDASPELVAERILEVLGQPVDLDHAGGQPVSIDASIGIVVSDEGADAEGLLHTADLALYEAKNAGKNRYVLFEANMQTVARDRVLLERDLQGAVAREQLFLLYQPTFDLRDRSVTGVEALLRWRHPVRGIIEADQFVPIAERAGTIVPIGRWVLHQACAQAAAWRRRGYRVGISVNISARQFDDVSLVDDVRDALDESGLDPAELTLEVAETTLMRDPDSVADRLAAIKTLGVRVAMDDFGTGYSSLAYLRRFKVDALKIDRSFISGIAATDESAALIRTLVQLGRTLGLETLAEGIEDHAQLEQLQREHCDYGQGFFLSRPLVPDAIEPFLSRTPPRTRQLVPSG